MPPKRTPPTTPTSVQDNMDLFVEPAALSLTGSAPNLSCLDKEKVTTRLKRKREDNIVMMDEIRDLLSSSSAQADSKFAALQSAMTEIIAQNAEIKESIAFTSKQYDDVMLKIDKLESERKVERSYVQQLEAKVENLERLLNVTKLEIKNIPRKNGETKEDMRNIVLETAQIIGMPVQPYELKDVFRSGRKDDQVAPILVDFSSVLARDTMIKKVRQYNTQNGNNKLSTSHLKIEGQTRRIYVAEKLTQHGQRMHYLARTFARDHQYKHCWTSYGRVFMRKEDGGQYVPVDNEADLINMQNN